MGWISPTGFVDSGSVWAGETLAYDENTSTYAYARQAAGLSAAAGGASSNGADVTFPTATAGWGTVTHVALVDHAANVNWGTDVHVLMWSILDASKAVDNGDTFKINAGDLDVTVE